MGDTYETHLAGVVVKRWSLNDRSLLRGSLNKEYNQAPSLTLRGQTEDFNYHSAIECNKGNVKLNGFWRQCSLWKSVSESYPTFTSKRAQLPASSFVEGHSEGLSGPASRKSTPTIICHINEWGFNFKPLDTETANILSSHTTNADQLAREHVFVLPKTIGIKIFIVGSGQILPSVVHRGNDNKQWSRINKCRFY